MLIVVLLYGGSAEAGGVGGGGGGGGDCFGSLQALDTNVSMVLASMTSWGRSFQSLMVLGRNEYTASTGFCSSSFSKFVKGKHSRPLSTFKWLREEEKKKKKKRKKEEKKKRKKKKKGGGGRGGGKQLTGLALLIFKCRTFVA